MAYRRLLLPLTGTAAGESALGTALIAARIWGAHVHCLHVRVDARDVSPLAGVFFFQAEDGIRDSPE